MRHISTEVAGQDLEQGGLEEVAEIWWNCGRSGFRGWILRRRVTGPKEAERTLRHLRARHHLRNGIDNFWYLVGCSIHGAYVSVDRFHARRYFDEQTFRFNTRKDADAGRFLFALEFVVGKCVSYDGLVRRELCVP